jgi:hypothetical protein
MVDMARAASVSNLRPEYEKFLFATIGADKNGTMLSVLSAMARMDLDPWQEAASLAQLPGDSATHRLAALIAAVPGGPSAPAEQRLIAARLITLLPNQTRLILPALPLRKDLFNVGALIRSRMTLYVLLVLIAVTLAITGLTTASRRPSTPPDATQISGTTVPPGSPLSH